MNMLKCFNLIKRWILRILSIKIALKYFLFGILFSNIFWIYLSIKTDSIYPSYKIRNMEFYSSIKRSSADNVSQSLTRYFSNTSRGNLNRKMDAYSYHERSSAYNDKRARANLLSNSSKGNIKRKMIVHSNYNKSFVDDEKLTRARQFSNSSQRSLNRKIVDHSLINKSSAHNNNRARDRLPHHTKNSSKFLGLKRLNRKKVGRKYVRDKNAKYAFGNHKYTKIRRHNTRYSLHLKHRNHKPEPPMVKMLHSLGQYFGKYVDDPKFKELHDFRKYHIPNYLDRYKNPCLIKEVKTFGFNRTQKARRKLRCVPYFMIAGFPKCGTTDLWFRLKQHPAVVWKHMKEVNFFHKRQYNFLSVEEAVNDYQNRLSLSTSKIRTCVFMKNGNIRPCITGDASVDTIFDNKFWNRMPGNDNLTELALTNANYVHKVNPNMKILVLVRDPVERLYSDYLYMSSIGYIPDRKEFHHIVLNRINAFNTCRKNKTLRACTYDVYDDWDMQTYKVRLTVGIYHVFLSDWLKVFPRSNILVIKSENTKGPSKYETLTYVFKFLSLPVPRREYLEHFYNGTVYKNKRKEDSEKMFPLTRTILHEFYKEFNQELEKMFPHIHY